MRREVPVERVLFALLLGVSLLLLSVAMLRNDMTVPTTSTRTFRDGFIVADRVERRTETASPSEPLAVANNSASATAAPSSPSLSTPSPSAAAAAAAIHVSGADAHTTTIKMDDGDEITIKRGARSSKHKITTISTHDDGKITIENRDHDALTLTPTLDGPTAGSSLSPVTLAPAITSSATPAATDLVAAAATEATSNVPVAKSRSIDFVGAYEQVDDADDDDALVSTLSPTSSPSQPTATADGGNGDSTHEIVVGQKKVTVVSVGRAQTTVSLADAPDSIAIATATAAVVTTDTTSR